MCMTWISGIVFHAGTKTAVLGHFSCKPAVTACRSTLHLYGTPACCVHLFLGTRLTWFQVTRYLGYSSLKDFFPTMDIKPNPGCANSLCRKMQQAYQQHQASPAGQQQRQAAEQAAALQQEEAATHDDNEWGIEVISEPSSAQPPQQSTAEGGAQQQSRSNRDSYDHSLPEGLQYETPVSDPGLFCFVLTGAVWQAIHCLAAAEAMWCAVCTVNCNQGSMYAVRSNADTARPLCCWY